MNTTIILSSELSITYYHWEILIDHQSGEFVVAEFYRDELQWLSDFHKDFYKIKKLFNIKKGELKEIDQLTEYRKI